MPGFKFELGQLVTVPGKDQPGRVSGRMEFVGEPSLYQLKWLDDDCLVYTEMYREQVLLDAQKPAATPQKLSRSKRKPRR